MHTNARHLRGHVFVYSKKTVVHDSFLNVIIVCKHNELILRIKVFENKVLRVKVVELSDSSLDDGKLNRNGIPGYAYIIVACFAGTDSADELELLLLG
jgi:hypothetical protein